MSLVLYLVAIGSVVVCVLFGLGYWRFAGMDGPRNGGFPYPRDEDVKLPNDEQASLGQVSSAGQAASAAGLAAHDDFASAMTSTPEPATAKVAWAPTAAGSPDATEATPAEAETQTRSGAADAGLVLESAESDAGAPEGAIPPEGDSNAPSTGDDGAPTAHMPDLSD